MSNRSILIVSALILAVFFVAGLLDLIYNLKIMDNLVSKIILIGSLVVFIGYLIKVNMGKHKKNLSE